MKFEYRVVNLNLEMGSGHERLQMLGEDGWELVSACPNSYLPSGYTCCIFKRCKETNTEHKTSFEK